MTNKLASKTGIMVLKCFSKLPFWMLYCMSTFFYVIVYYIFRYRRKIVNQNLCFSFPEKSSREIKFLEKKFYSHFCDLLLETLKDFDPQKKKYHNRIDFSDTKILNGYYNQGKSVIVVSFHYGNWEWTKFMPLATKHTNLLVYNEQRNLVFDNYFNRLRAKHGGLPIETKAIFKKMLHCSNNNDLTLTWLGADQTPPKNSKFWTLFLNQETPFFPGPGKLALKTNQPILFQYMQKTGRGKYKMVVQPLIEEPSKLSEFEILQKYSEAIEKIIVQQPEYYLWSHRRWKHTRPTGTPLYKHN